MATNFFSFLHFCGILFWVGSAVAVAIAASAPIPEQSGIAQALRKVTLGITTPAMLIAFAGGFGVLVPSFVDDNQCGKF